MKGSLPCKHSHRIYSVDSVRASLNDFSSKDTYLIERSDVQTSRTLQSFQSAFELRDVCVTDHIDGCHEGEVEVSIHAGSLALSTLLGNIRSYLSLAREICRGSVDPLSSGGPRATRVLYFSWPEATGPPTAANVVLAYVDMHCDSSV